MERGRFSASPIYCGTHASFSSTTQLAPTLSLFYQQHTIHPIEPANDLGTESLLCCFSNQSLRAFKMAPQCKTLCLVCIRDRIHSYFYCYRVSYAIESTTSHFPNQNLKSNSSTNPQTLESLMNSSASWVSISKFESSLGHFS